jgi:hypothetical protein
VNEELKDSGERRATETGAVRDRSSGKGRFDLLMVDAIFSLAKHLERGASKYADRNWEKGMPLSWFLDSALRHGFKELRGDTDEPHADACLWNVAGYIQTKKWIERGVLPASLNDLPTRKTEYVRLGQSMPAPADSVESPEVAALRECLHLPPPSADPAEPPSKEAQAESLPRYFKSEDRFTSWQRRVWPRLWAAMNFSLIIVKP